MRETRLDSACLFFILLLLSLKFTACGIGDRQLSVDIERGPVEIGAHVDKAVADPGDIITFTLSADCDDEMPIDLPEVSDRLVDFRIVSSGVTGPVRKGERVLTERWYKLQADVSGSYVIEPVEIALDLPTGERETFKTPKIFIEIQSLLERDEGTQDIRDIKPPVSVYPPVKTILSIAALAAGLVGAVLIGNRLIRNLRQRKTAVHLGRKQPHEIAMQALQELLMKRLVEQGRVQEFYFELSLIFRQYIQDRFLIPAVDFTTEEILHHIDKRDGLLNGELKPLMADFLTGADLVKFAKHEPPAEEVNKAVQQTIEFIGKTAPLAGGTDSQSLQLESQSREHVSV